ncbi:MAG: hypothetical protein LBO71_05175 [Prevotellaceae bacterium]|nr:hypothetical protein [Prevotellaceae bacterium]
MEKYKSITDYPDVRSAIRYAEKRAWEKNWKIGWIEGWKIGWAEGWKIGREESRKEIVQNCALLGMPVEEIAKVANLTVEQVVNFLQNTQ